MTTSKRPAPPETDAEIEAAAAITPADIERAMQAWKQDAPARFKGLLDADPDPESPHS